VAIDASVELESLSVKVHLYLTWLLSKKYDGPYPTAHETPFGSLVKFITPYLTL